MAGLKSLLGYHGVIGIDTYPLNRDVQSFLQVTPQPAKEERVAAAP
ncbi:MAG: hypothetical protein ACD_75C01890G0003, partial [uncultured bacterium]